MQYTTLGHSGLIVSRLAFGAMTFGVGQLVPGVTNSIDQAGADQMVGRALDAGINFFDTADMYTNGQSETMLGQALAQHRHEVIIATKVGFRSDREYGSVPPSYHGFCRREPQAFGHGLHRPLSNPHSRPPHPTRRNPLRFR